MKKLVMYPFYFFYTIVVYIALFVYGILMYKDRHKYIEDGAINYELLNIKMRTIVDTCMDYMDLFYFLVFVMISIYLVIKYVL